MGFQVESVRPHLLRMRSILANWGAQVLTLAKTLGDGGVCEDATEKVRWIADCRL